jgi:hypothetical protein
MNDSLLSIIESAVREGLDTLDLHGLGLTVLPPLPAQLLSLRRLDLSDNDLRAVPDEVFRLAQLEVLNLAGNRITQLDARIGRLKKLRVLDLSQNQLTSVDANVLPGSLQQLVIDGNPLKETPGSLYPPKPRPAPQPEPPPAPKPRPIPEVAPEPFRPLPELAPDPPASGGLPLEEADLEEGVGGVAALPAAASRDVSEPPVADAEPVDAAVFCPPQVIRNSVFLLQVFIYPPRAAAEVDKQAQQADETAERRGTYSLPLDLPLGTRVDLRLEIPSLKVEEPDAIVVWRGSITAAQFEVEVPNDVAAAQVIGRVRIAVAGVPTGTLRFKLDVVADDVAPVAADAREVDARRYRRAFVSYSSKDRAEVLRRVQAFKIAGLSVFQDVLDLDPGERWENALYREIDSCDVFLLFWSKTAAASEWVLKEIDYAVARKQGDDEHPPAIQPVPIEGPPIVPPPPSLKDLHFNDSLLAQIQAADGLP